jgi:thioredoxin reductase (NADPH)
VTETVDVAIVGAGPAGLTAGLYAARARASTVVLETAMPGGQIVTTDHVENYPGFPEGLPGAELGALMQQQAERHGAELRMFASVESLEPESGGWRLTVDGEPLLARTVILATGATPRKLGVPGEAEYTGRGVSWCAVCDGAFFRDKAVAVVGGGDAAVEEAMFLTKFVREVHLIHRRGELRATKCIQERCFGNPCVQYHWNRTVTAIVGDDSRVTGIELASTIGEPSELVALDGVFIYAGIHPNSDLVRDVCDLDDAGFVRIDANGMTSAPGLFAAGDVTNDTLKQVVTAAGQGATAAFEAVRYLDTGTCTL